jgi:hypothetical protein
MKSTAIGLVRELIAPYPGGLDPPARFDVALALMLDDAELPVEVAEAVAGFVESATEARLLRVQVAVAQSGLWTVGPDCFVALVARLTAGEYLKLEEAARLLAALPYVERESLSPAAVHLVEVADAVVEDAKDGVMEIDDDAIFRDAVHKLLITPVLAP